MANTYKFQSYDLSADHSYNRQMRVDALLMMENSVVKPLKEAGKIKVYRGNPKKNWQVLDFSFDDGKRNSKKPHRMTI
jgi:hypothetical protein